MPTNRPFLYNFLAAFRAHPALQKAATPSTSTATTSTQTSHAYSTTTTSNPATTTNTSSSNPRTITTKGGQNTAGATTAAIQIAGQFQPTRQHSKSPYSTSPGSPGSPGFPLGATTNRQRRGSDSSTEGFREVIGAEKWYIGGRTANGEERFYKLGMIKRPRSVDRLSIDRVSL